MKKDKGMHVAIIEPVGGHGGMNFYDFALAKGVMNANCNVTLYTSGETVVQGHTPFRVLKTFNGVWGGAPKIWRAIRFFYGLIISLVDAKRKGTEIAHFHFFHYTFLEYLTLKITKLFRLIPVITAHDVESFSGHTNVSRTRNILSQGGKVIAHSSVGKNELVSKVELPSRLISVVPLGNHLDSISNLPDKPTSRKKIGLEMEDKVCLFFGQIKKVKGLDVLLKSIKDVIDQHPDFKLVIAGKVWKDDFVIYENIIKEYGLEKFVDLHIKYIPDSDIDYYFQAADIIALPYRRIYQSDVLIRAMSYKTPVLTSNIDGMVEVIQDGEDGFLFEAGNSEDLSDKLNSLLADNERMIQVGMKGFEKVKNLYSWDKIGQMTARVYRESIGEG